MIKNNRGVTAVELLFVLTIFSILLAIILPKFSEMRERQVLKGALSDITSSLNKARSQTLASFNSSEYGVRFEPDKVIIFKGDTFSLGATDNETINIVTPASISNVTLNLVSGNSGEMYFSRLSGSPSKTGTITVSTPSTSKIITISNTGAFSID